MSEHGHNSGDVLTRKHQSELKGIFERLENIDAQIRDRRDDRSEILRNAKERGFDRKIIAAVIRLRRQDADKRQKEQDLIDQYIAAIEPLPLFESATPEPAAPEISETEAKALETYQKIKAAVIRTGNASISAIQKLADSNSAVKPILKMLELDGVISAPDTRNRRKVLIPSNPADYPTGLGA